MEIAVTFVSTILVISKVFLSLPPPISSCSISVPPINIWTFPLLESKVDVTSPIDFAGNEVDSFERTSETASKFITGDIVISSENGKSNWSEPVNEYVVSGKDELANDDEYCKAFIVYVLIPVALSITGADSGGAPLPEFTSIGVDNENKFFRWARIVALCPLGFGERVVGSYINWFTFDVTISWGALSPSSNLYTVSNSTCSSIDAV